MMANYKFEYKSLILKGPETNFSDWKHVSQGHDSQLLIGNVMHGCSKQKENFHVT